MKLLILLLLLSSLSATSQRIALLSKDLKQPIIYTDSLTAEQVIDRFPVEISAFDTLHASLVYLRDMLKERQRSKMKSFELRSASTSIYTTSIPHAYGDHFEVIAKTKIGEVSSIYALTSNQDNNSRNSKRINSVIKYIENNKSLFTAGNEIHPRIYNVMVITK